MRIAIVSDIHGNASALEAVLTHIEGADVDRVYVLGDVVNGGPESQACWDLVRDRADGIVRGNHERYVLAAAAGEPVFMDESWAPARWTAERLSEEALRQIAALPYQLRLDHGPPGGTLLCHASPRSDDDMILPDTPDRLVAPMVAPTKCATVVRGHNHEAFERAVAGLRIIAVGSAGLPFGEPPQAEYAVLVAGPERWTVTHHRIPYDVEATMRACRESGYLDEAGPVARLFALEIATGRRHLSPFMRGFYDSAVHPSLREAVELYLA